jgi:hypothetical protein
MKYPCKIDKFKNSDKIWQVRIIDSNGKHVFANVGFVWDWNEAGRDAAKHIARAINSAYIQGMADKEIAIEKHEYEVMLDTPW